MKADLVVAADGLNSLARTRLWPDARLPRYAGSTAWRSVTHDPWDGELTAVFSLGRGAEFGIFPLGDGRIYWYAAVNAPPNQQFPDEMAEVHRRFGYWHDPIPAVLAATSPESVLRHDIYELATPLPTYVRGRVALLGDAAHAMTPNLGQGACQSLEDAVVLGAVCAKMLELSTALAAYDAQRRPRTQQIARASHLASRFGQQLQNPAAVAVRNTMMRLIPPRITLSSMTRIASWRPPEA